MLQTTLTSKGQVTIPKHVRDSLCLHAGDKVEFIITENNEVLIRFLVKDAEFV
jgi:AbrB family looped-hinge helix DNA binding protein